MQNQIEQQKEHQSDQNQITVLDGNDMYRLHFSQFSVIDKNVKGKLVVSDKLPLDAINGFKAATVISFVCIKLEDLDLSEFEHLEQLNFYGCTIYPKATMDLYKNFCALSSYKNQVRFLFLDNCEIYNMEFIGIFTNLHLISLVDNLITNIQPLSKFITKKNNRRNMHIDLDGNPVINSFQAYMYYNIIIIKRNYLNESFWANHFFEGEEDFWKPKNNYDISRINYNSLFLRHKIIRMEKEMICTTRKLKKSYK